MNFLTELFSAPKSTEKSRKETEQIGLPRTKKGRRGVQIKSPEEVTIMRQSSLIVATVLKEIQEIVKPGMTTGDLDNYAEQRIREMGATPSFKGYYGFPGSICASINHEVVHGIPNAKRRIRRGDVLKVDTGAYYQGYHGDSCITIAVDKVSSKTSRLIRAAEDALYAGIREVKAGKYLADIAGAIEDVVHKYGYSVVEDYTGHGVGQNLHEEPPVFNYRTREIPNIKLKEGMTLAIEPIVNEGSKYTKTLRDRWTVVTVDNRLSAQFEHTVLVTATGYEILTDRTHI
ncbi:type I methionyl aminopeptidase [Crocosphaera watsonii WH 8501]|uniref:Methionine aminopeptidase n=5 Tax=Crocosphaera watsonii TaxID=263511 RepID=Q4C5L5_CROWT|nr:MULTISPECIES: type I methionyl aminopeptidase [Crocosphaera]EAM51379.1 Peptidase M24A, methionine aminopeptidase, subfamily 1 [Crocosphaera watsonii WH 8501]EHJ13427.1 Methionine aminopeptidase [Crocosphaera watsonii WH 0003]MCH2246725.1 type I methionyl aminopeptidase [Crocosphaera sp.]NQZ62768.1 type I methionyl aminopeptidase [Crocosphaera sp.]CCQ56066.1 Methionine aminopeptidase [Crocosphaera watsonii WH 0005]